jgi:hypothetical protein
LIVFALIFLFRFVLHLILNGLGPALSHVEEDLAMPSAGGTIDLLTPDDDELHKSLKAHSNGPAGGGEQEFAPLRPPKLVSKPEMNPEELANALRHMSEE